MSEETPELVPVDPLDPRFIPAPLRPWVSNIVENMSVSLGFAAVAAIVAVGSLIGRQIFIKPKKYDSTWLEAANLWGMVVADPGTMKTPIIKEILNPVRRLEKELNKDYVRKSTQWDTKVWSDNLLKEAAKPKFHRIVVNDITVEKLQLVMQDNPNGLLLFRDELSSLFKKWETNVNGERGFYLESWGGDGRYAVDRKTTQSAIIDGMCLSIFGAIQPDVLMKYVSQATSGGELADGMLQRFQLAVFPDPTPYKYFDKPTDYEGREKAFSVFQKLQDIGAISGQYGNGNDNSQSQNNMIDGKRYVGFDDESQVRFENWLTNHQNKLNSMTQHPAMIAHLQKFRKLMPSLCLIFHCIEAVDQNKPIGSIGTASVMRAEAWCQFLERHAQRIYAYNKQGRPARMLLRHIKAGQLPQEFTQRDLKRKNWSGLTKKEEIEEALDDLVEDGVLQDTVFFSDSSSRSRQVYKMMINI